MIITQFGGTVFFTVALTLDQWLWSLLFGVGDLLYAQVTSLVSSTQQASTSTSTSTGIGGATPKFLGGPNPSFHLFRLFSLLSPLLCLSLPSSTSLPFPFVPLVVGLVNTVRRSPSGGQRSPNGVCGRAPAESEFVHFSYKI